MKAYIKTFGCQMNENDSERMMYLIEKEGYSRTYNIEDSDLIMLNTCAVREKAKNRLYGHIGNLKNLKYKKNDVLICIGGCISQSIREKILKDFPFVDIVFGTHNIAELPQLIKKRLKTDKSICSIHEEGFDPGIFKVKREKIFKAYVPISIGCDNYCSYCIVPFVRGREKSIEEVKIIENVKDLVIKGVIEIMLLGQNVNSYGNDLNGKYSFSGLLEKISDIKGLKRIRFMTSHPKDFSLDIIDMIKSRDNLVKHIHLPLQSGSDKILKKMNRSYTRKYYFNIISNIRRKIPHCAITTDIIVGFPGEERSDFMKTLDMIKSIRYNRAFTFIYSPREGTKAFKMNDCMQLDDKKKWFRELIEIQQKISFDENKKIVGKKFEVLVEGNSKKGLNMLEGRMENNTVVNFKGGKNLIGKIVPVIITGTRSFYVTGDLFKE
jgi:tRNA-2-methylthio-N6-dimethylallyladenosine synthase